MQALVYSDAFKSSLKKLGKVVDSKALVEVCKCVRIESLDSGMVTIEAVNLDAPNVVVTLRLKARNTTPGVVILPYKPLYKAVSSVNGDSVNISKVITLDNKGDSDNKTLVNISSDNLSVNLESDWQPEDYPETNQAQEWTLVNMIDGQSLKKAFTSLASIVDVKALESLRFVQMVADLNKTEFVGTDGYRLCKTTIKPIQNGIGTLHIYGGAIIPELISDSDDVVIFESDRFIKIANHTWQVVVGKEHVSYPQVDKVMNSGKYTEIIVSKPDLIKQLKSMVVTEDDKCHIKKDGLSLSISASSNLGNATMKVAAIFEGDADINTFINQKLLLDIVKVVKNSEIVMRYYEPLKPLEIVDGDTLYLIMPMKIEG